MRTRRRDAFTVVELLVAMSVLALISLLLLSMADQTSRVWRSTTGKLEPFREARSAFETMTTRLGQATLGTYWDYDDVNAPTKYQRRSELRFIAGPAAEVFADPEGPPRPTHCVFFTAPLGVTEEPRYRGFENLLCTWGYFLEYGDDEALRPSFIPRDVVPLRHRSRLKELREPAEENSIYFHTSVRSRVEAAAQRRYSGRDWFLSSLASTQPPVRVAAENIVALIITPRLSQADEAEVRRDGAEAPPDHSPLAPGYFYDSSPPAESSTDPRYRDGRLNPVHQLPPVLQVTLVAIDERSAANLGLDASTVDAFGLEEKFKASAMMSADLLNAHDPEDSLESRLIARRTSYRIFSTNVIVRAAKWSREQTN
jgi:uncharacterized protein (TIGR02599 family)